MPIQRILVRTSGEAPDATLSFGATPVRFTSTPLFRSIGRTAGLAAAPDGAWYILTSPPDWEETNPWDMCYALLSQGFGVAGAPTPDFAEPDLPQHWLIGDEIAPTVMAGASCEGPEGQDPDFPTNANPFWFRDAEHAQLDAALDKIGGAAIASRVRIAHFDTGYDPDHNTRPARLRPDLARNFVDPDRPNDATDTSGSFWNHIGHGTGTLGILAGAPINGGPPVGAAPFAEIVPVRVADRVVLFYTSAIAQAFDYIHGLNAAPETRVDIVTISMGGLASQAWAEAVNAVYDQGVFIAAAAGNNRGKMPTRHIVYPARFNRVIAACGVMANQAPYADLGFSKMGGNYGPPQKMATALSAYTPNIPWARIGCPSIVDLCGAGTSSATPQVAAAAAVWSQHNKQHLDRYSAPWMRIEAIRKALFDSAHADATKQQWLGRGTLRANEALARAPAAAAALNAEKPDSASFPILRILTGLGLQAVPDARGQMIELEALQLSQSAAFETLLPDAEELAAGYRDPAKLRQLAEALVTHPRASHTLKSVLQTVERERLPKQSFSSTSKNAVERLHLTHATDPKIPEPTHRPLRIYAYDPSLGADLATLHINETMLDVRWESDLQPGPVGEYIEVIDVDPASRRCYAPVDLNHPHLLTRSGLSPSEANPQFHQQMVYAVAMKTIEHFEHALGRTALWAPRRVQHPDGRYEEHFVRRLRIYPHAVRAQNAFYSPERKALLLGYFRTKDHHIGRVLPGGVVFTAVSHDIIAHETTHALLDGLHRRFREPTNKDVLAFHEAFADIVALFQHFTLPAALREQIRRTRGNLAEQNLLAKLAVQFGEATGRYGALRDAIGKITDDGWQPAKPDRNAYKDTTQAHELGAVLVAAVFDAFLQIYKRRTADLIRLATGGTGILPEGDIPADLVDRLAQEASKVASQVLTICIRALDYCPPIDLTFGEYLRALITADTDLVPDDRRDYRTAFIAAFRDRGIYPRDVRHLASDSLMWEPPPLPLDTSPLREILDKMSLVWSRSGGREAAYEASNENARKLWHWLMDAENVSDDQIDALGLIRIDKPKNDHAIGDVRGQLRVIEVHSVRPARRVGPDGRIRADLVVEITQTFRPANAPGARYRGGCTLLIDLETARVRYLIRKKLDNAERLRGHRGFTLERANSLRTNYFDEPTDRDEPFALLHMSLNAELDNGPEPDTEDAAHQAHIAQPQGA